MSQQPRFDFRLSDSAALDSALVIGAAGPGMASLIAVDHLISALETEQVGYARTRDLPVITPFTDGTPRHPVRLYDTETGPSLLISEVAYPVGVGELFADAIGTLSADHGVEEITVLYSVPYPHGPDDHDVFFVATESYPTASLRDEGIEPLSGGFLDGYAGRILEEGLADQSAVATLITPGHPPGPDIEGTIRLVKALAATQGIDIETATLEKRSEEIHQYYQELTDRMKQLEEDRDLPEDRMYM